MGLFEELANMSNDIHIDMAELLSLLLEVFLYGISLPMFAGTIWALSSQRSTHRINIKMLAVACLLLLFSTVHLVISTIRVVNGLISLRDGFPGGPSGYFSEVSQWTFVSKNYVYTVQTLIGDGVVLYRCYVVWRSILVMILPMLLWCAVVVTGFETPFTESRTMQHMVFEGTLSRWIIAFWASTLATNLLTTLLLAYRIWHFDQGYKNSIGHQKFQLRPILCIILDSGAIYSVTLFVALICFVNQSNGQYVILDMVTPIISITFFMVIIRVGLANRANQTSVHPVRYSTSTSNSHSPKQRNTLTQGHVTSYIDMGADDAQRSSMGLIPSLVRDNSRRSGARLDNIREVV